MGRPGQDGHPDARGKALRYGLDGVAAAGWTASTISVDEGCYGGSTPVAVDGDDTLVIGGRVTLLDASGAVAQGWPARPPYDIARMCPDCTPGPNAPLDPAIGADGIYVGAYGNGPRVVALGRDGAPIDASSRVIGKDGDMLDWVRIAPSGRVWALLRRAVDETSSVILVPVAQDGVPAR